ncbi:MAG: DUF4113 domain-containing protein, partial [Gammaproteobacteria bacterium]
LFDFSSDSQGCLWPDNDRREKLMKTLDKINLMFGARSVFLGSSGIDQPWRMRRDNISHQFTSNWKELLEVR